MGGNFLAKPRIVLVGNGPYANRGCEAIVRGTMEILRATFESVEVKVGSFGRPELIDGQSREETDPWIRHFSLLRRKVKIRWTLDWFRHRILRMFGKDGSINYNALGSECSGANVAVQIGGDNYSLDYGIPYNFMLLDRWFFQKGIPVVLWGASVGPFDRLPDFKEKMLEHLKRMELILVRESESYNYLMANGVTENVDLMPDPAFVMKAVKPNLRCFPPDQAGELVGLSLSPLMAKYTTDGDLTEWTRRGAAILSEILRAMRDRLVILVPHVINEYDIWSDDLTFLKNVVSLLRTEDAERVILLPPLSAAEYKWLIGQCKVFAGARTHSTIASFSQCVPTVSLAYSIKAIGLNRDLLGTLDFCITPEDLSPGVVAERMQHAMTQEVYLRQKLSEKMVSLKREAINAGAHLRKIVRASA